MADGFGFADWWCAEWNEVSGSFALCVYDHIGHMKFTALCSASGLSGFEKFSACVVCQLTFCNKRRHVFSYHRIIPLLCADVCDLRVCVCMCDLRKCLCEMANNDAIE